MPKTIFITDNNLSYTEYWYSHNKGDIGSIRLSNNINYIPHKGQRLFFDGFCSVPRFKLKDFHEKHGTSTCRKIEDADVIFISKQTLVKLSTHMYKSVYNKKDIVDVLKTTFFRTDEFKDIVNTLNNLDGDIVLLHYWLGQRLERDHNLTLPNSLDYDDKPAAFFKTEDDYKLFNTYITSNRIYYQESILSMINSGTIMDGPMFENVKKLLESEDRSNHKVAIECLSNCDFEKSCVYLLLLLKDYGNTIYDSGYRNQVNFKSLVQFFDLKEIRRLDIDDLLQSLIKRKLLNKSNLDLLMPLAIDRAHSHSDYFEIKEVIPKDEVITAVQESILNNVCDTTIVDDTDLDEINPNLDLF